MRKWAIGALCAGLSMACGDSAPPAANPAAPAASPAVGNQAPRIESLRLDPADPAQGSMLSAVVIARDPDAQSVTLVHRWFIDGEEQLGRDATLSLDGVRKGASIRAIVTASDGILTSEPAEVTTRVIDRPPRLISTRIVPEKSVTPGQPVSAGAGAGDPDGDAIDFEYTWYVNGDRRSETGAVLQTDGLKAGDTIYAEVRGSDGESWTDPMRTDVVTVGSGHPEITSSPPGLRDDGVFRYQVVAVDPDGDKRLRYRLDKAPDGMTIDEVLGDLVWRPSEAKPGVHPVSVVVRDSGGLETKQSFSVTIEQKVETIAAPTGRRYRVRTPTEEPAPASNGE